MFSPPNNVSLKISQKLSHKYIFYSRKFLAAPDTLRRNKKTRCAATLCFDFPQRKIVSSAMEKVLEFTSLGNAIISELLKISELIPEEFKLTDGNKKYNEVIMDFR